MIFERFFRWRWLLVTLVPGVAGFVLANESPWWPWGMARLRAVAGHERIPDIQPGHYDAATAYALITGLGEGGRDVYRGMLLAVDIAYPVLYGLGLAVLVGCLVARCWRLFALLPLAAALADWGENACALAMLGAHPGHAVVAERLIGWCTAGKWLLLAATLAVVAGGAVLRLVRPPHGSARAA